MCDVNFFYKLDYGIQAAAAPDAMRFRKEAVLAPWAVPVDLSDNIARVFIDDSISISLLWRFKSK